MIICKSGISRLNKNAKIHFRNFLSERYVS